MWSAFIKLSKEKDQIKALKEMLRILKKGGFAFLEMPKPEKTKKRVVVLTMEGIKTVPMYRQNKITLARLIGIIKPKKHRIFIDNFGGRDRILVIF